jgi:hypothetical protein
MRGMTIDHAEKLSGSWEAQGDHTVYGLHIQLTTRVGGAPITLVGVRQVFYGALIEVYERTGPTRRLGEGSWFSDESSQVLWTNLHLVLNHPATRTDQEVQLNLTFDPVANSWSGRLHRGTVDRWVTLVRPHPQAGAARSPFVGTWKRLGNNECIHIVQTGSVSLAAWSDNLATPGASRYANGIRAPLETFERYGAIALVEAMYPKAVLMELDALTAGCCSITYAGILTLNGKQLRSRGKVPIWNNWARMRGDSCVAAA